jgi:hypothetical protein
MVDRDADLQGFAKAAAQCQQRRLHLVHRLHRIGQHQRPEAAPQGQLQHLRQCRVHKRLAAGKPDQGCAEPQPFYFVEIAGDVGGAQIDEAVVFWRRFDVAMAAGQVAQSAGIKPERV